MRSISSTGVAWPRCGSRRPPWASRSTNMALGGGFFHLIHGAVRCPQLIEVVGRPAPGATSTEDRRLPDMMEGKSAHRACARQAQEQTVGQVSFQACVVAARRSLCTVFRQRFTQYLFEGFLNGTNGNHFKLCQDLVRHLRYFFGVFCRD